MHLYGKVEGVPGDELEDLLFELDRDDADHQLLL